MSSEPQIIKRVRSRASRVRDASPPPTDAIDGSPATTPDTLATKLKNKQKKSRPKSRLSFGTDDQVMARLFTDWYCANLCCGMPLVGSRPTVRCLRLKSPILAESSYWVQLLQRRGE